MRKQIIRWVATPHTSALLLIRIRWLLILAAATAVYIADARFQIYAWLTLLVFGLCNCIYQFWLKTSESLPRHFLSLQLFIDLLFTIALLYIHGGATNGMISVLLLPTVAAALLTPRKHSWILTIFAIAAYSLMMNFFLPIDEHTLHMSHQMSGHYWAMWQSFVFSVCLLTWFVSQQAVAIRDQHHILSENLQRQFRDEQILAVATLSANAAHDLATPLANALMMCEELRSTKTETANVDELVEIEQQLQTCSRIIKSIAEQAQKPELDKKEYGNADAYLTQLINRWWVTRNDISLTQTLCPRLADHDIFYDLNLSSAIANLLNNSADASVANNSDNLKLHIECTNSQLTFRIDDEGEGVPETMLAQLGKRAVASEKGGMGLGLVLANATIERFNGRIWLQNTSTGVSTFISLPLSLQS